MLIINGPYYGKTGGESREVGGQKRKTRNKNMEKMLMDIKSGSITSQITFDRSEL